MELSVMPLASLPPRLDAGAVGPRPGEETREGGRGEKEGDNKIRSTRRRRIPPL